MFPSVLLFASACSGARPVGDKAPVEDTGPVEDTSLVAAYVDLGGVTPKNVVVVHVDTLRADSVPRWGGVHDTLPLLEARPGWVSVERAVSTATWTAPATASLVSGTDLPTHGVRFFDQTRPHDGLMVPTFASYLAEQGLQTAFVTGSSVVTNEVFGLLAGFGDIVFASDEPANAEGTVRLAIEWLDTLGPDENFLLVLQPMDPHVPYRPDDQDLWTWADPETVPFDVNDVSTAQEAQIGNAFTAATTDEERAQVAESTRAVYDEQVLGVDRAIDALMSDLAARGRLDDTLIVLTADHGESFFDGVPLHMGHGLTPRKEVVGVPLLFWGADTSDAHVPCVASNMDVFPTIVDAMGLAPLPSAEGRSLLDGCRDHAFSGAYIATGGVETLTYLAVQSLDAQLMYSCVDGGTLAFDLVADPFGGDPLPVADVPGGNVLATALDAYVAEVLAALPSLTCAVAL